MTDYIEREAAMPDAFCVGVSCQECPFCVDPVKGGCKVEQFIATIPAANVVEQKRGKWLMTTWDTYYFRCSVCGEQSGSMWPFCHHCGADMRGEKDNG